VSLTLTGSPAAPYLLARNNDANPLIFNGADQSCPVAEKRSWQRNRDPLCESDTSN
jgi:hypothetical protein